MFLKDFVQCSPGTAGGRLAAWLQPENCGVMFRTGDLRCSWLAIITLVTRDQCGAAAHVPNTKMEGRAIPIDELNTSLNTGSAGANKMKKLTQPDGPNPLTSTRSR